MKKYKASVSQLSVDQITIQEQANRIADMEEERNKLKEQIAELSSRIESLEGENVVNAHQNRLELKIKELESKLELEQTTRARMETQINRLKEGIEKINSECDMLRWDLVFLVLSWVGSYKESLMETPSSVYSAVY